MKTKLYVAFFIAFYSATLFGQPAEKQSILKMAKSETEAYLKGNLEEWQSYRMKNAEASMTFVANSGYNYIKGWDSINGAFTRILKAMPQMTYNVKISNPIIKVNGNLAWAEYNQIISTKTKDTAVSTPSNEMRVLIKENGKWKILTQVTTNTQKSDTTTQADIENDLNTTGYKLLSAHNINDAIEVFKLNVKLHPNSWNPYDSLGEAYALAGNKDLAIENYETSVKLNPKNDNGKEALKKLGKQ